MADHKHPRPPWGSLQLRAGDILAWGELTPEDFRPAGSPEATAPLRPGPEGSYRRDAWRRFRGNRAALGALAVLLLLVLFALAGPLVVPYGYAQFHAGAENLPPYHYALADQERLEAELSRRAQAAPDPEEAAIKRRAADQAYMTYVLADSSKFGQTAAVTIRPLEKVCVITERIPDESFRDKGIIKELWREGK